MVLLYHGDVAGFGGGFLGVEVFFVLSGYLVTAMLLAEWRARGRIDRYRFWTGRVRRLVPAAYGLLLVVAVALVTAWAEEAARVRGEALAATGFLSNWYLVKTDQSYFAAFGRPSPVRHLWSLAVEAQFYLLWPLLFIALARRIRSERRLAAATLGMATLSVAMAQLQFHPGQDPSRVYYGTDARASGLLLGCALAFCWRPFERPAKVGAHRRWSVDVVTGLALVGLLTAFTQMDELADSTYRGGILAVSLLTAVLVATAVHPQAILARWLFAGRAAQVIGRRSYSLYLWHWPVFVFLRPGQDIGWSPGPTLLLRLAITVTIAELSYRCIERPVRSGALSRLWRRARRSRRGAGTARRRQLLVAWSGLAALLMIPLAGVVILMATRDAPPAPFDDRPRVVTVADEGRPKTVVTPMRPVEATPPSTTAPAGELAAVAPPTTAPVAATTQPPAPAAGRGTIYALGDSVMLSAAAALDTGIPGISIDARVARQVDDGIATLRTWQAAGGTAEAIVVHLGNNGTLYGDDVDTIMGLLGSGSRVVFLNVRVPRQWEADVNWSLFEVVPRYPNARLVDWRSLSDSCPPGSLNDDGVHLTAEGGACYAELVAAALH